MSDKEKIKEEIERRLNLYESQFTGYESGRKDEAKSILDFINSLPEEHNKDFDFLATSIEETIGTSPHSREVIKEYLQKAAQWQKQQMIEDAVETTIVNDWQYGKDQDHAIIPAIHQRIKEFTVGDKVKIIIIKED